MFMGGDVNFTIRRVETRHCFVKLLPKGYKKGPLPYPSQNEILYSPFGNEPKNAYATYFEDFSDRSADTIQYQN